MVEKARGGDPDAFREIVEYYEWAVYTFSYRWLHSPEDAQEVAQDTFLRAYRGLSNYRHEGKLSTWLFQIALNLCRDRRRSPRLTPPPSVPLESSSNLLCNCHSPDQEATWKSDLTKLTEGLEALPRRLREPLILCGVQGLSHDEASSVLKCSPRAIEGRVYRARQRLGQWWEQHR